VDLQSATIEIESAEFAARVNLASDTRSLVSAFFAEPAVGSLADRIRGDDGPSHAAFLSARVAKLATQATDVRFEHPSDAALAAYLWLLSLSFPKAARVAAANVLSLPNLWWGKKIAEHMFFGRGSDAANDSDAVAESPETLTSDRSTPTNQFVVRGPEPWVVAAGALERVSAELVSGTQPTVRSSSTTTVEATTT